MTEINYILSMTIKLKTNIQNVLLYFVLIKLEDVKNLTGPNF